MATTPTARKGGRRSSVDPGVSPSIVLPPTDVEPRDIGTLDLTTEQETVLESVYDQVVQGIPVTQLAMKYNVKPSVIRRWASMGRELVKYSIVDHVAARRKVQSHFMTIMDNAMTDPELTEAERVEIISAASEGWDRHQTKNEDRIDRSLAADSGGSLPQLESGSTVDDGREGGRVLHLIMDGPEPKDSSPEPSRKKNTKSAD